MNHINAGLDAKKVKPWKLPSLPLGWRKGFPKCPAIYFAISGKKILYIGKSINLASRWAGHHRLAELEQFEEVRIAWIEVSDRSLLLAIEKALIQYFKPTLNARLVKVRKPKGRPGNSNPTFKLTSPNPEPMSEQPLTVRVPLSIDSFVRSLPNRNEWLRNVIAKAAAEELKKQASN